MTKPPSSKPKFGRSGGRPAGKPAFKSGSQREGRPDTRPASAGRPDNRPEHKGRPDTRFQRDDRPASPPRPAGRFEEQRPRRDDRADTHSTREGRPDTRPQREARPDARFQRDDRADSRPRSEKRSDAYAPREGRGGVRPSRGVRPQITPYRKRRHEEGHSDDRVAFMSCAGDDASQSFDKEIWKPGTLLSPVPIVMVTCAPKDGAPNITTVAWTGTVCSEPPMLSISLRQATLSHSIIMATREFVVNVPSVRETRWIDYCGVASGRDVDKFKTTGLTPGPASTIKAPLILECPINLECSVKKVLELGLHTMFLAEITAVQVTRRLIDGSNRLNLERAGLVAYAHGAYYALGKQLGTFGFSVRKRKKERT